MNERIKELAEQAGFCHDINNGIYLCAPMHMEKFAELIVQECAGQCFSDDCMRILNYFGIKYND